MWPSNFRCTSDRARFASIDELPRNAMGKVLKKQLLSQNDSARLTARAGVTPARFFLTVVAVTRGSQTTTLPAAPPVTPMRRVAGACLVGSAIEFYDFLIYGTAAALVFPTVFFPHLSPAMGTIASMGTFASAFVSRPIGGVAFGYFGGPAGTQEDAGRHAGADGRSHHVGVGAGAAAPKPSASPPRLILVAFAAAARASPRVGSGPARC